MVAKGVLEPATSRFMIDFGSFAQLHDGDQTFGGRSGRRLATLGPFTTSGASADMMWLLQLLRGTTDAIREGEDVLHGTRCIRLTVRVDLEQASAATAGGLSVPPVDRFEQLRSLPATVWIDGEHIRRVRLERLQSRELTLELWDYGLSTEDFNWSRLPTFRSPDEAAMYAGEGVSRLQALRRKLHFG
jgi:hypothetical protein